MLFTLWSTLGELLSCVCGLQPYGYIGGALTLTSQSCYLTSFLPHFKPSSFFTTLSRSSPTVHNPPFTSVSAAFPSAQRLRPAHTHFPSETYQVLHCPTAPGARCSRNCSSSSAPQQCFSFEIKYRSGTGQANSGRHQEAAPGTAWSHPRGPPARDLPLLCSQGPKQRFVACQKHPVRATASGQSRRSSKALQRQAPRSSCPTALLTFSIFAMWRLLWQPNFIL